MAGSEKTKYFPDILNCRAQLQDIPLETRIHNSSIYSLRGTDQSVGLGNTVPPSSASLKDTILPTAFIINC